MYRDGRPPPPNCPTCKQPAAHFEPLAGCFICPARHWFDADLEAHRGCDLGGLEPLEELRRIAPSLPWRARVRVWWVLRTDWALGLIERVLRWAERKARSARGL